MYALLNLIIVELKKSKQKEACEKMNPPISFLPNDECHFAYNGIDLNTYPCHE